MPLTVNEVCTDISSHLNDQSQTVFTTTVMIPFIRIVMRDLEALLLQNNLPLLKEIASVQTISAGGVVLTTVPDEVVVPIKIEERPAGSVLDTDWVPMTEKEWLPNEEQTETLRYWQWREQAVAFLGATADREVKYFYKKLITEITDVNSTILLQYAQNYIGYKAAAQIAERIGENPTRAEGLKIDASAAEQKLVDIMVQKEQQLSYRRKPYSRRVGS